MLEIEVEQGGGARISGTEKELLHLADWIIEAARLGYADPAFAADIGLTCVEIVRTESQT